MGYKKQDYWFLCMGFPEGFKAALVISSLLVSLGFVLGIYTVQAGFYEKVEEFVTGDEALNGSYEVAGTPVHFTENINGWDDVTGHVNESGIWIKSGRSVEAMTETCRHEFLHKFVQENTDYRDDEELVEILDTRVNVPECQNLLEKVEAGNPQFVAG